ncbi:sll0787 family AIR synthase-like protein [Marinomonas sp.]
MLQQLIESVRNYPGVASKVALAPIISSFEKRNESGFSNGDDTAVLKSAHGYDLFAIEGFLPEFVKQDPWFAGWCGVMVNVSDIAAMGGRAKAVVNALWSAEDAVSAQILAGMKAAATTYSVPVVGGHTSHNSQSTQLAVSILGHANEVLTSFAANTGDAIVVAMDQRGSFRAPYLNWNATTNVPAERLREDLELLPMLAEKGWVTGCKDISQAGLLGTLAMFMDCSRKGADVFLQQIPKPDQVSWPDWLCAFPSFGFVMTCPASKVNDVVALFSSRAIHSAMIGYVTDRPSIEVMNEDQKVTFWDFEQAAFLGFREGKQDSSKEERMLCQ